MANKGIIILMVAAAALIVSATATIYHPTPRHQLRKRTAKLAPAPPPAIAPIYDSEQEEYLKVHNEFRALVGVPPLVWDANLTAAAKSWANQRRVDCDYRRHSPSRYGESLYFMDYKEFTPRSVVEYWFKEHLLYNHMTLKCMCYPVTFGCECGHYLNIIWKTTLRLGCSGSTYCNGQLGLYVVCNYDPPGLIPGINPFTGNKL